MAKPKVVAKATRKAPAKVLKNAKPAPKVAKTPPAKAKKVVDESQLSERQKKARLYYIENRERILQAQKDRYAADPDAVIARVNKWREETDGGATPLYKQKKNNGRGRAPRHIVLPRLHENAPVPRGKPAKKNSKKAAAKVVPSRKPKVAEKPARKLVKNAKPAPKATRKVAPAKKVGRKPMR